MVSPAIDPIELQDIRELEEEAANVIDEATEDVEVAPVRYDISSSRIDFDVEGLVRRLRREDILIPPFQRNYVWNQQMASRFVESLLLGLPVPGVFLSRERNLNKLLVVDGQQRLRTLQFFYDGVFNPQQGEATQRVFRLSKVHPRFEGLTYGDLAPQDQVQLNDSIITATVIKQESPSDDDTSMYHIFDRLNTYGRKLTPQEIRTAIDHGPFIDLIRELNEYEPWRLIYGPRNRRLKDQEFVLRFLALHFDRVDYAAPMAEFLNKFSSKHRHGDLEFLSRCRSLFTRAIDVAWNALGDKAFRPTRAINAAVYDSVMVAFADRLAQLVEVNNRVYSE